MLTSPEPTNAATRPDVPVLLRLGLFTDAHYAPLQYGDRWCVESLGRLRACVAAFNAAPLAAVIGLGDLIDKAGSHEEELAYLSAMAEVYAGLNAPRHLVLGNHDVATLTKAEFLGGCGVPGARPYYSFDLGGVHLVVLDSVCHPDGTDFGPQNGEWDNAWIGAAQLDWLSRDLADAARAGRPALVFCHVNLEDRVDAHVLRNAADVRRILEAAGNVRAVFQGHYHYGLHTCVNGIWYVTLRAMVLGSGAENNAFAIMEFHADGGIQLAGHGHQPSHYFSPVATQ